MVRRNDPDDWSVPEMLTDAHAELAGADPASAVLIILPAGEAIAPDIRIAALNTLEAVGLLQTAIAVLLTPDGPSVD
jgi:hypothetical protein